MATHAGFCNDADKEPSTRRNDPKGTNVPWANERGIVDEDDQVEIDSTDPNRVGATVIVSQTEYQRLRKEDPGKTFPLFSKRKNNSRVAPNVLRTGGRTQFEEVSTEPPTPSSSSSSSSSLVNLR